MTCPHILIVDDTSTNLQLTEAYLDGLPIELTTADSGEQALELSQRTFFNAIFMDIEMPGMNGLIAAKKIREHSATPIIAMTGHAPGHLRKQLQEHGINGFLAKPFDDVAFIDAIDKYCDCHLMRTVTLPHQSSLRESLPTLDIAGVRKRLRNNHKLIHRILDGFINNNIETYAAFEQAIAAKQWEEAKRIAHTLKGAGGNIGAMDLSTRGAYLEERCEAQQSPSAQELKALNECLLQTMGACKKALFDEQVALSKGERSITRPQKNEGEEAALAIESLAQTLQTLRQKIKKLETLSLNEKETALTKSLSEIPLDEIESSIKRIQHR